MGYQEFRRQRDAAARQGRMAYIRWYYRVPAQRGMRVRIYDGREGVITSADELGHLRIRLDGERKAGSHHPTWRMEYLGA